MRGMSNTAQLNRSLPQGNQLPSHVTPASGVAPTMSLHTPPSPSRYTPPLIGHVLTISIDSHLVGSGIHFSMSGSTDLVQPTDALVAW